MKKLSLRLFYIGPVVLWMLVIFGASARSDSGAESMSLLVRALAFLVPQEVGKLTPDLLDALNHISRKAAHITEYAILTLLMVRALQFGQARLKRWSLPGAALLGVLYACSDEIHQIFVPSRGPSFTDVLIDSIGIALALAGIALWFALKSLESRLWRANALSSPPTAETAEPDTREKRIHTG